MLLDAHVFSIVRAFKHELNTHGAFSQSFTLDKGIALHTVLFHLLGGADSNLPPPPRAYSAAKAKRCAHG